MPNTNRLWTGNSALLSTNVRRRPWTGHSRPTTARPQTAASVRHEGSYVIAVLEGRGVSREVGIAALDRDTGHVMLVQVRLLFVAMIPSSHGSIHRLSIARHMSSRYTRCIFITHVLF